MANKADLIEKIAATIGSTKADAERTMECVIDFVTSNLKKGEEVSLAGLGIFESKTRPARMVRNPRTGEKMQVGASKAPRFRASKTLKDAIN